MKQIATQMPCHWQCAMSLRHKGASGSLPSGVDISREHLYNVLASKHNPRLNNLLSILSGLGFQVRLEPQIDLKRAVGV